MTAHRDATVSVKPPRPLTLRDLREMALEQLAAQPISSREHAPMKLSEFLTEREKEEIDDLVREFRLRIFALDPEITQREVDDLIGQAFREVLQS